MQDSRALIAASLEGNVSVVKALLSKGAKVEGKDEVSRGGAIGTELKAESW